MAFYADNAFHGPYGNDTDFQRMLADLPSFDTSDSRDHVYGVLGMYQRFATPENDLPRALRPDYNKSLQDVFRDATMFTIQQKRRLDALYIVNHWTTEDFESPAWSTWVPRWNRKWIRQHDPAHLFAVGPGADRTSQVLLADTCDPKILSLSGFIIDTVHAVTPTSTLELLESASSLLEVFRSAEQLIKDTGGNVDHLGHVLATAKGYNRAPLSLDQSTRGYSGLKRQLEISSKMTLYPPAAQQRQDVEGEVREPEDHYRAIWQWCCNRRFFVTTAGHMGVGPQILEQGDVVAILYGSALPVVLRRRSPELYGLVGTAYVHGVMEGEAFDVKKCAAGGGDVMFNLV